MFPFVKPTLGPLSLSLAPSSSSAKQPVRQNTSRVLFNGRDNSSPSRFDFQSITQKIYTMSRNYIVKVRWYGFHLHSIPRYFTSLAVRKRNKGKSGKVMKKRQSIGLFHGCQSQRHLSNKLSRHWHHFDGIERRTVVSLLAGSPFVRVLLSFVSRERGTRWLLLFHVDIDLI